MNRSGLGSLPLSSRQRPVIFGIRMTSAIRRSRNAQVSEWPSDASSSQYSRVDE